ncbi:MAG: CehA/McbA family metallohydrolase [Acidobacteria bacterium]|nr:CehA/McbA family metallohydrolase [Acidobacteriota bacterium]MBI3662112.1 CehA/McbA family metallohydrolase [Acidobacteriota bacterium]
MNVEIQPQLGRWSVLTIFVLLFLLGSTFPPHGILAAHTVLMAKKIERRAELCRGPEAKGEVGHFLLMNAEIKAVISAADYAYAFSSSGGNILDIARTADNYDGFTHFYTLLNTYWPNQAHYTSVKVLRDGRDGELAVVRAAGHDLGAPNIKVVTDYQMGPHDRFITIVTTLANQSDEVIGDYAVGDAVQWGVTDNFAPGVGYELLNVNQSFPWVAAQGDKISYGYAVDAPQFDSMNHSTWTDSYLRHVTLNPHHPFVFKRYLSVGTGSVASAVEVLLSLNRIPLGTIDGYLREEATNAPIPAATIILSTETVSPFLTTTSDGWGHFVARVPPGSFVVSATAPGRAAAQPRKIDVEPDKTTAVDFGFGARGVVRFEVRDAETDELLPAKLVVTLPEGPNPYLGSPDKAAGALNNVFTVTGAGAFAVPPGHYRVAATHGLAFGVAWSDVTVSAGAETTLRMTLRRELSTPGWFTADFHVHASPSDDSTVSLPDRVTSLVAEGVQIVASTDHNVISDYSSTIRNLGLTSKLFSLAGDELTTVKWGHFNVFPVLYRPDRRWGGAMDVRNKTPETFFAEARAQNGGRSNVVQVNHPRWPYQKHAYFDSVQLDVADLEGSKARGFSLNFDALEIMNGLWSGEDYFATDMILKDWFALLNRGYRFTAVGNSDSHAVATQEVGYPRNYVFLSPATTIKGLNGPGARKTSERAVVQAIKHHRVVVSNGPFVSFTAGEQSRIGDMLSIPPSKGTVKLEIHVQWPEWMGPMDTLRVFANGKELKVIQMAGSKSPATLIVEFSPTSDTWVVVAVRGSRPMDPVLPSWKGRANTPFAITNPIWIDRDGNGTFDSPAGKF